MTQAKQQDQIGSGQRVNAVRATASVFGAYAGLLGFEHGLFEAMQGNAISKGMRIMAVGGPGLPFPFGHEPAMTVIPNFLATGILAMLLGMSIMVWSSAFLHRKHGALVLFLLSVLLLLFGGGFGPISLLITACIGASKIDEPLTWWRRHLPVSARRILATLWPWSLGAALLWVPLEFILGQILHLKNDPNSTLTNLNLILTYPMLGLFVLTLIAGFVHEIQRQRDSGLGNRGLC
jgi:hypothetical protein